MNNLVSTAKQQTRQAGSWVEKLARLGYGAKGLVYIIIGILAVQAAIGSGGQTTGSEGAFQTIASQPFGQILLGIVALGFLGYAIWMIVRGFVDADDKGSDAKGLGKRSSYVINGLIHLGLAISAFSIVIGSGNSGGGGTQGWTAQLMSQPYGRWLVAIVGLVVIGVGLYRIYKGYTEKFRDVLKEHEMSVTEQTWAIRSGKIGLPAQGIVLGIIGIFLIVAAIQANPNEARGLGAALDALAAQPYGPWLLGIVALGLVAHGAFNLVLARYRKIQVS